MISWTSKLRHLSPHIMADVVSKIEYFQFIRLVLKKDVVVFGDNETDSRNFWTTQLKVRIPMHHSYLTNYPLIPIPPLYQRELYEAYESELDKFISDYKKRKNYTDLVARVMNFGSVETPRMHLILTNGRASVGGSLASSSSQEESPKLSLEGDSEGRMETGQEKRQRYRAGMGAVARVQSSSESRPEMSTSSLESLDDAWIDRLRRRLSSMTQGSEDSVFRTSSSSSPKSSDAVREATLQEDECESLMDVEELPKDDPALDPTDTANQ